MSKRIVIDHTDKYYGKVKAIDDVSLEINPGEFFTLLGPSGCGKTTLLRMIAGFNTIERGEIRFDDQVINNVPSYRRNIGMVFQSYAIFPHMTVEQNVAYGLKARKIPKDEMKKRVEWAMNMTKITPYRDRQPQKLSGGQQQRVALARAMVINPDLLLMDEPLSNLDAKLRVEMRTGIRELQREMGITTIYVTHDQEEALTLSDRIAVFNKGIIEQIGTPNEVYNHSQTEFVCNFIGDINRLNDDTVSALRAAGAEVDASKHNYIRLERLHVNVAPRGGEIALDGTVESCEYYGLYIKYYIHVGTQSLKVIEKNDGVNIYDPGQRVKVILNPNDIMAYAPSAEEVE